MSGEVFHLPYAHVLRFSPGMVHINVAVGPYGTLSPFKPNSVDPVGPCGMLFPPDTVAMGPVGPSGTLSSPDPAGILFPAVPAGILFPVGPVGHIGPYGTLSPSDSDSAILVDPGGVLPSSDLAGIMVPAVVAMVGFDVMPMGKDTPLDCVDKCAEWDIRDQFETIDGMAAYYGGDLCNSDESDWDDLYDIASAEYVEQYNFDVPEGMELVVFE